LSSVADTFYLLLQAFTWFADVLLEHNEMFWSLFTVDMDACLETQHPENWEIFSLFSLLNSYLLTDSEFSYHGRSMCHSCMFLDTVLRTSALKSIVVQQCLLLLAK